MAQFNPKDHEQQFDNKKPSPGAHILEFHWGKMTTSKKGTPGLLCRADVVHGPEKGRSLFETIWLTEASFGRLAGICASVGQVGGFDPEDEDELKNALFNKAFRAVVELNDSGYHELKSFTAREKLDEEAKAIVAELDAIERAGEGEYSSLDDIGPDAAEFSDAPAGDDSIEF